MARIKWGVGGGEEYPGPEESCLPVYDALQLAPLLVLRCVTGNINCLQKGHMICTRILVSLGEELCVYVHKIVHNHRKSWFQGTKSVYLFSG